MLRCKPIMRSRSRPCFAIYATRGMSALNDVTRLVQYHSDADSLVFVNKAVAQVSYILGLLRFTYRPSRSHSAHASTSTGPMDPSSPRPTSPSVEEKRSTPTGSANGKSDGAIYFECLNCKRQVSWILHVYPLVHPLQHVRPHPVNLPHRLRPVDMPLTSPRAWGSAAETAVVGHGTPTQSPSQ